MKRNHRPERTCIGCGRRRGQEELVRFQVDEGVHPPRVVRSDRGSRAGRGAYLCVNPECLDAALGRRGFSRAFRGRVDADRSALFAGLQGADGKTSGKTGR